MKNNLLQMLLCAAVLLAAGSAANAGGSEKPLTVGKPKKITAVIGKRENISIPGPYAAFKCIDHNMVCLYKIEAAGRAEAPMNSCHTQDVSPETFPPIFEENKLYVGYYDSKKSLKVQQIESFNIMGCNEEGTHILISPKIEIIP